MNNELSVGKEQWSDADESSLDVFGRLRRKVCFQKTSVDTFLTKDTKPGPRTHLVGQVASCRAGVVCGSSVTTTYY